MPWKPVTHEHLQRDADPRRGRAVADRDYRLRRRDERVDPLQAEAEAIRHSARWRKVRAVVLAREPLCRACLAHGVTTAAEDVDHVVALVDLLREGRRELAFALENLQPLCRPDHAAKSALERLAREAAGRPENAPHSASNARTTVASSDNQIGGGVVIPFGQMTAWSAPAVVSQNARVSEFSTHPPETPLDRA